MDRICLTMKGCLLACLLMIIMAGGCASFEDRKELLDTMYDNGTSDESKPAFNTMYDVFPEYRVMPGDILEIFFKVDTGLIHDFKIETDYTVQVKFPHNPELNEVQIVRPDGTISMPYIGDIKVIGKTVDELTKELKGLYSHILNKPTLYVVVPEFRTTLKEFKADLHTAPRGLSRLVTVRPDGIVTFPIVGEVFAAKKTLKEINISLNSLYEKIIPGLHCNLFLEKQSGFLVYVFGEVRKPGAFPIVKPISVLEALSLSESTLPSAKTRSIIVLRKTKDKVIATKINLDDMLITQSRADFMMLNPDDVVYVPRRTLTSIADVAKDIGDIVFFRGWGAGFNWQLYNAPTASGNGNAFIP
ncbi:MAG: polysaccharide biosynthesis/export family protein [Candidatus Magnetominusculus sp. LBB02]|nr:polysaccharide biosynthesis/export family protein [Candidatus Magnetominusculus sp. LBB02]